MHPVTMCYACGAWCVWRRRCLRTFPPLHAQPLGTLYGWSLSVERFQAELGNEGKTVAAQAEPEYSQNLSTMRSPKDLGLMSCRYPIGKAIGFCGRDGRPVSLV